MLKPIFCTLTKPTVFLTLQSPVILHVLPGLIYVGKSVSTLQMDIELKEIRVLI
jgi:hypothetical protein